MQGNRSRASYIINNYGALFAFVAVVAVFSIATDSFFRWDNFKTMLVQSTSLGICAFGLTLILMTGEIDFSYGGIIGLVGAVLANMLQAGYSPVVSTFACLFIGAATGLLNAFLVVGLNLSSFLSTVAVMFVCMGTERMVNQGTTVWIKNESILQVVQDHIGPFPTPIVILISLFLICWIVQTQTRTGQNVRALGENMQAVKEAGIRSKSLKTSVFIVGGLLFAFGGLIEALRNGGAVMYAGKHLLLFVLAASYIGTATFKAGKPNLPGTFIGALFLITLMNGFTLMGMKFYFVPLAQGLILIASVAIASVRRREMEQVKL